MKQITEHVPVYAGESTISMIVDVYTENGITEYLDTEVKICAKFVVTGASRKEFAQKIVELIEEYSI